MILLATRKTSKMVNSYTRNLLFLLFSFFTYFNTSGQVTVTVTINSGSSTTTCTDGPFGGGPELHWQIEIDGQGNDTYPSSGICFNDTPNQQYSETFDCPPLPAQLQVCIRAFEDDGFTCVVNRSCLVSNCQNFNVPAPGASANYTINVGGASTATANFTIAATGSFVGATNDLICNAINLGTLLPGGTLGNANLSNYNNFCASNVGEPNPGWTNEQGVWFSFTTSNTPSATIQIDGYNDPQNLGDLIDMQLALYESSNGTCTGVLTLIEEDFDPVIYSESMQVECLSPNTTYFILVDGDDNIANLFNGQEGFFGMTVVDDGVIQAGDEICDAEVLGPIPTGGSVSTPPLSQSNVCATDTNDPTPGAWGSDQGVWYEFSAPPSGHVNIAANSDAPFPIGNDAIDLQLAVYGTFSGTCTGTLVQQESDYDPGLFDEDLEVRCLTPGESYWVFVDGSAINVDGIFDITITDGGDFPATNDSICQAIHVGAPVIGTPAVLNDQTNWCANNILEPIPNNWANEAGVWFTFIAPPSGVVDIQATSDGGFLNDLAIDIQLAVYDSDDQTCTGNLTEVESEYDGLGATLDEDMIVECLVPGRLYYILLDGEPGAVDPQFLYGQFDLVIDEVNRPSPLGNDLPCQAVGLGDPTGVPITTDQGTLPHTQNNWCATNTGEPTSAVITNPDMTVWYTFVAPSTGNLTIDVNQTGLLNEEAINTEVTLFSSSSATCTGPFTEVETDASLIDLLVLDSDVTIKCLNPGETYWLMIDGEPYLGDQDAIDGNFDITLTEDPVFPPTPNDLVCNAIAMGNPITAGPLTLNNQNNLCADDIGDPTPSAFSTDQTVWYSFTTPPTGGPFAVEITTTSDLPFFTDAVDLQVAVFESSNNTCTGTFSEVESDYDIADFPPFNESVDVQCLEEGNTYYVMVDGSALNVQGNFDITIAQITANPIAPNDLICDAIALGNVPMGGSINNGVDYFNFCADIEPGEPNPSAFGIDQTVWFTFTTPNYPGPNGTADITINVESDPNNIGNEIDLQIAVYESGSGTCAGPWTEEGSDYDAVSFPLNDESLEIKCLDPNTTYWLQVDGSAANIEGYFTIEIVDDGGGSRPLNDDICDAEVLGPVPNGGSINNGITYTNLCSTIEPSEPNPSAYNPDNTVWFTFVAPASGNATIDLDNQGGVDLQVGVFFTNGAGCTGVMLEHDSDYDGGGVLFDESLSLECLIAGRTYYVQVDGSDNGGLIGGAMGDFTIEISDDGGSTVFPYNDTICNAHDFGLIDGTAQVLTMETNVCANIEPGEPGSGGYAQQTVWYEFTAPASGSAIIDLSANSLLGIDSEIYLFSSSDNTCNGTFTLLESDYDATQALDEELEATCLIPGDTYFLQIDGTTVLGPDGEFTISIQDPKPDYGSGSPTDPEPVNNACIDAIPITVQDESCTLAGGAWQTENYGCPTPDHQPTNCNVQNCGDTWYQFTMPPTGIALVEGDGTAVGGPLGDYSDMTFVIYRGGCNGLNEIDCESQDGLDPNDYISMEITGTPGETIFIQVINEGGDDDDEDYNICVSEKCGADNCLDAIPMQPNVPYCWDVAGAEGDDIDNGAPGYYECSNNTNPDASVYFTFTSDCNGSAITLSIIDAEIGGTCILGTTPTDGFNISLFEDATPCDGNPDALVDCQNFDICDGALLNWQQTYTGLSPNTEYVLQIDGFGQFLGTGGDAHGEVMITTGGNPTVEAIEISPASCNGASDGVATASASNGAPPYVFVWDTGITNSTASNLDAGVHTVTVYDDAGCFDTTSVVITQPDSMLLAVSPDLDASCWDSSDGSGTVSATGGTAPYSYDWDTGETTQTATNLGSGTHTVTVTDDNGCLQQIDVVIGGPPIITAMLTPDSGASCNGVSDGSATVSGSGGVPPYSYDWDSGETTQTATGLGAGTHTVTVTDVTGCTNTFDVSITEPDLLVANATMDGAVNCNGESNGSATVTHSGGTPGYTYDWNNGETTPTATGLGAGTNTVTVTDMNGCVATATVMISQPDALVVTLSGAGDASCNGLSDGTATVSATGGVPPYTYDWDSGETTTTATGLGAGTHTVSVTDDNGCVEVGTIIIGQPDLLEATASANSPTTCAGNSDGSATVTATGGTNPYTYDWDSGETTQTATGLGAGTHTVTVTDTNGCLATTNVTIIDSPTLIATASQDSEVLCNGGSNGSATATATGGTSPYSYDWDSGETTQTATGLDAGDHTVTVTDDNGCSATALVSITEPLTALAATATQNSGTSCNGDSNGSATVTASGGTPMYTYDWDTGETTQTATNLGAGTHTVTITDSNGCIETADITITEPAILMVTVSLDANVNCNGESNGSATATATGGTPPYAYDWDTGETTQTASGLGAGAHSITITDMTGCSTVGTISVTEPSALIVSASQDAGALCFGESNGTATATSSDGTSPYTYTWDSGEVGPTATGLDAGTHVVTTTDANGCTATASVMITEPDELSVSISINGNVTCNGSSDGSATATVTGGILPYAYDWSNGETTSTATGLGAGTHTITITDTNNCTITGQATIAQPSNPLVISIVQNNGVDCNGSSNGSATVSATGGTTPYTYEWNNGEMTPTATGLTAGGSTVTVTDSNGCTDTGTINITEPPLLSVTVSVNNNVRCNGGSNGSATATPTGGTNPYTYDWNNGETTQTATSLTAGTNTVTITDDNGCQTIGSITISQPDPLLVTATQIGGAQCNGQSNGTATASATDGTAPYAYNWDSGEVGPTATGLTAGNHVVTATDANGCTATASVTISEPPVLNVTIQLNGNTQCNGSSNGSATATATGGTSPYGYNWDSGEVSQTATGLNAGTHSVTVTDANGCETVGSIVVGEPGALSVIVTVVNGTLCNGGSDGSATASGSAGTAPYSYEWDSGEVVPTATGLTPGTHTVTVTDSNGCSAVGSIVIGQPNPLIVSITLNSDVSCNGLSDGSATATTSGGTPSYSYVWDNGQLGNIANNLDAGMHVVTVTDNNGCTVTGSVFIGEPTVLSATATANNGTLCNGSSDGSATANPAGGTMPYSYQWDSGHNGQTATNLDAGNHVVTITDDNGCSATASVMIAEPTSISVAVNGTTVANCTVCDGSASITVTGGTPPYTFNWSNNETTEDASALCSGINSVTVTDANNCSEVVSVTIGNTSTLVINTINETASISCNGVCDATVVLTPSGGNPPYIYTWNNGGSTNTITGLCAGNYSVTLTDQDGCIAVGNILVSEPDVLNANVSQSAPVSCFGGSDGAATVAVTGGTSPYTYQWSNTGNGTTTTGLGQGTVSVTVTDQNGCEAVGSVNISAPADLPAITIVSSGPSGCSACTGSATITVSGGTGPYVFDWSNGGTIQNPSDLCAGINTVTATDANGCITTAMVTISNNTTLGLATTTPGQISCNGDCTGVATVAATGGALPYNYQWSNGSNTNIATGLCAGSHSVTVTGSDGCLAVATVSITEPDALIAAIAVNNNVSCNGLSDGSATVSVTGGTNPYSYTWTDGTIGATNNGLNVGTHQVTVVDANGCSAIESVSITEPGGISIVLDGTTTANCSACDGGATITVSGGQVPYTYQWSNGANTEDVTGLCGGIAAVTVTDINGCNSTLSINIGSNSSLSISSILETSPIDCNGACNGEATVVPSGGTPPYTYQWDSGQTSPTATGLCAGTFNVTVLDASGCVAAGSLSILEPSLLSTTMTVNSNVSCTGDADGSATVNVTGGTLPYAYQWDSGEVGSTATLLDAGTHAVTVTDNNGCTSITTVVISEPVSLPSVTIGQITAAGCSVCDGTAVAAATGGTGPYTYVWSVGTSTSPNPTDLCPGVVTLVVTDANGCVATANANIPNTSSLGITISQTTSISCNGDCNGTATVSATGGVPPFSYQWDSPGQSGSVATGLCAGTYNVTVTGADNCFTVGSVFVAEPAALTATASMISDVSCNGFSDGSAIVLPIGGTTPYLYLWDSGETTATAIQLTVGTHMVTVTDDNGCVVITSVIIGEPGALSYTVNGFGDANCSACDGTADISILGGTLPYTYNWQNGTVVEDPTNLCAGTHAVTVTDANGCMVTGSVVIGNISTLNITNIGSSSPISCNGVCDGEVTVNVVAGSPPYTYQWDSGQNSSVATGLCAGTHAVTVTDTNGCVVFGNATITEPAGFSVTASTTPSSCSSSCDGTITLIPQGGTPPYNYQWSNGGNGPVQSGICSGNYTASVTDANGCVEVVNAMVTQPSTMSITLTANDSPCFNEASGSVNTTVTGGSAPYTYNWNNGATTADLNGVIAGSYTVTVTDSQGCFDIANVSVSQPSLLAGTPLITMPICYGEQNGIILIDTTWGGVGPYEYSIDGISYHSSPIFQGLGAGAYSIHIQDANGCVFILSSLYVNDPAELQVDAGDLIEIVLGDSVQLEAMVNSNDSISYTWTPIDWLTCEFCPDPISKPFDNITYNVTVMDEDGCEASDVVTITVDKTRNVFIPNTFTPNGDGINDVFTIFGGEGVTNIRTMKVFDRWGELVFENANFEPNDPSNGWDGTFKGKRMNPNVFVYYVEVDFIDGETILYKGDVTLIK